MALSILCLTFRLQRCFRFSSHGRLPFFFQAEDGIRYPLVTGVQTCALPISLLVRPIFFPTTLAPSAFFISISASRSEERRVGKSVDLGGRRIIKKKKKK